MNPLLPIPAPDPLPLPAPAWLLQLLLGFTFVLHLLPMNVVLGGSFVAAWAVWRRNGPLAQLLVRTLPVATALTITLGVAPLLFLQVLYGQFFYAASILMAAPWILVVPLLIAAYYGFYFNRLQAAPLTGRHTAVAILSAVVVLAIGFIYTNNLTLMLTPERWRSFIANASTRGLALDLGEPTLWPRFLHFTLAAFAVTGLYLALRGHVKAGAWLFAVATLLNLGAGLWFLFSLPDNIRALFLAGNGVYTAHLWAGVGLAVVAVLLATLAVNAVRPRPLVIGATACLVMTIALMVTVRHFLRREYLAPYLDPAACRAVPMWDVFAVFAGLLVAGLAVVAWMLLKLARAKPTG